MEDKPGTESPEELSESYDTGEVLVHKFFFFFRGYVNQSLVVQTVDNAIHWINNYPVDSAIVCPNIYPADSTIQRLNNQGQKYLRVGGQV